MIRSGALGLLAGLVSSLCCLGPSAAILIGLGSSSALAGLALDRGVALAVGLGLLVAGVLLARRQVRACTVAGRTHWRQPALMLVIFAVTYGIFAYLLPIEAARQNDAAAEVAAFAPAPVAQVSLRRATLSVEKMYCPPCASHIRSLLRRKPYVHGFFAEATIDEVTVDYDSRQTSAQSIMRLFPQSFGISLISDQALE